MSIKHSYDSVVTSTTNLKALDHEIAKILLRSKFPGVGEDILFVTDAHDDVDSFIHPYWRQEQDAVYIDTRGYSTVTADGTHSIRPGEDYDMWLYRAKLELVWIREDRADLFTAFQFANEVFVRWLTSLIAHNIVGLSPLHEQRLMMCVALFNVGRYFDKIDGFRMVEKYVQQIVTTYKIGVDIAFEIADICGDVFPRNVDEFIELVKRANVSAAVSDDSFNRRYLYNLLGGSLFMVSQAQPITFLALDYPPAFVAIVLMNLKHQTMRNRTQIGQRMAKTSTQQQTAYFTRAVEATIDRTLGKMQPGRKLGNESMVGTEGAVGIAAGVAGGCIFLAFLVWMLDTVFGGDKDPGKRAEEADTKLKTVLETFKTDDAAVKKAVDIISEQAWPDDAKIEALGEENRKIWQKLSGSSGGIPGAKLAIYEFAKSGGKGSVIAPGPLKYDGTTGDKFAGSLKGACDYLRPHASGNDPFVQAFVYSLLSNKPFTVGEQNNAQVLTHLGQLFDKAAGILSKIDAATKAKDAGALAAIETEINTFNTEIGAARGKGDKANETRGTQGLVKHIDGLKSKTLQLFNKETGEFNAELRKPENTAVMKQIFDTYSDPNKAAELSKLNVEAAKQLKSLADSHKSKFESYKNLGTEMDTNFEDKNTTAFKKANTFIKGKNDLIAYVQDTLNNSNNISKSLLTLASALTALKNALASKAIDEPTKE